MTDYKNVIKRWMAEGGVTFDELGNRLGCSANAVWVKVNKGKKDPQYDGIVKIANALGYKETLEKVRDIENPEISKFMTVAEQQRISFSAVEELLSCLGYKITFKKRW